VTTVLEPFRVHPSGVGVYLVPPVGCFYRIWRDPSPTELILDEDDKPIGERDTFVLAGYTCETRQYLEWDVPLNQDLTYRLEVSETEDGPYEELYRSTLCPEPVTVYSALQDGELMDAQNPRDALVVYYATRLAQLVRRGQLKVRNPDYKYRYNVLSKYEFNNPELPLLALDYSGGMGEEADLGGFLTEETLMIALTGVASSKEERDGLAGAVRGLIADVSLFLGDLNCINTSYHGYSNGIVESEPYLWSFELTLQTTAYSWNGRREAPWEIVPIAGWQALHLGDLDDEYDDEGLGDGYLGVLY